jgi:hypothetical protein
MKLVVSCFIAGMVCTSGNFLKPLNPILGETFQVQRITISPSHLHFDTSSPYPNRDMLFFAVSLRSARV